MNIHELAARTGIAERQIRYLIAEGFVPAPLGGRSNAEYGDDHIAAIIRYSRLRDIGFPPAAIRLLLEGGQGAPFTVAPGITLLVEPGLVGSGEDPAPMIEKIEKLLKMLLKDKTHGIDRSSG